MKEIKKSNIKYYDVVSEVYDSLFSCDSPFDKMIFNDRFEMINDYFKDLNNIRCIDIGCGTDYYTSHLQEIGIKKVIGMDISAGNIKECMKKNKDLILVIGDAELLPFKDESFNLITINSALHHFPNYKSCIQEIYRVLDKDGIFLLAQEPNVECKVPAFLLADFIERKLSLNNKQHLWRKVAKKLFNNSNQTESVQKMRAHTEIYSSGFKVNLLKEEIERMGFTTIRLMTDMHIYPLFFIWRSILYNKLMVSMVFGIEKVLRHIPYFKKHGRYLTIIAIKSKDKSFQ